MSALGSPSHTGTRFEEAVARLAARQHGLFTRAQALRVGYTPAMIKWRLRTRRWHLAYPNVYRIGGVPVTWRQRAMAACLYLGPRAALSFRLAARLSGMTERTVQRLDVTVTKHRNRTAKNGIVIHCPEVPIPPEDMTRIDGIPVTKPARTLLDLATVEPVEEIERYLDDALRRRLVSLPFLELWLSDPQRDRHRGTRILKRLVAERATRGVTDSHAESDLLRLIRAHGLPLPLLQYHIEDRGRFIGRVDFAYPEQRVAIEVDSFRHHDKRGTFDDERARGNNIEALGWSVLRITPAHVKLEPGMVTGWIERALGP